MYSTCLSPVFNWTVLQVVSCFYANLFFFINTTLFNSVMQLGPQRGVFTHSAGATLRYNHTPSSIRSYFTQYTVYTNGIFLYVHIMRMLKFFC